MAEKTGQPKVVLTVADWVDSKDRTEVGGTAELKVVGSVSQAVAWWAIVRVERLVHHLVDLTVGQLDSMLGL